MRKLASIQRVDWIKPIEGKDRIELAGILGWQVIVKKNEFSVGDHVVYIEIDSLLPEKPEFEFLRSKKFRIKTMKLGGVLSQGIAFPTSVLPNGSYELDTDVTDILGIKKYEPEIEVAPKTYKPKNPIVKFLYRYGIFRKLFSHKASKKQFPSFISKTDETRVQNIPQILTRKDITFEVTEKVDGNSVTFFLKREKLFGIIPYFDFGVCSRNLRLPKDNSGMWSLVGKYDIENVLKSIIGKNDFVAIQGEHVAPKVQGNKYRVSESDLYVFNLIFPHGKEDTYFMSCVLDGFGIKTVPILDYNYTLPDTVEELLDYATGTSKLYETLREGVVIRNYEHNISFKAVSPEFLIKNDE